MKLNKGLVIALGFILSVSIIAGVAYLIIGLDNNTVENAFSLSISADNYETIITEDTYNQSFDYNSTYTFEINCNCDNAQEDIYNLDITYYLNNSIIISYLDDELELNELYDVNNSIKYLFDVTENSNKFEISFYETIEEVVASSLNLDEVVEINFNYKVDQISLKFTCNEQSINLSGYINETWYYSFKEIQILF